MINCKILVFYCSWQIWSYFCQRIENSETLKVHNLHPVHKGIAKCICKNKRIRYTATRENILKRHKSVESNLKLNLVLHSVRPGGASAAARSDVNERCIKKHGKWKTNMSKDGYIADTFEKRLSVSKDLVLSFFWMICSFFWFKAVLGIRKICICVCFIFSE